MGKIDKAINFAVHEKKFALSIFIGGLLTLISFFAINGYNLMPKKPDTYVWLIVTIYVLIGFLIMLIPTGFVWRTANNFVKGKSPYLPSWRDLPELFITGIKISFIGAAIFILMLIFFELAAICIIPFALQRPDQDSHMLANITLLVIFIFIMANWIVFSASAVLFTKNLSLTESLNPRKIINLLSAKAENILSLFTTLFIMSFVTAIAIYLFTLVTCCIGLIFVPFISFWYMMAAANLYAQTYLEITEQENNDNDIILKN